MNNPNPIHASAVDPEGKKLIGSPEAGSPAGVPAPEIKVSAEVGHIGPEADDHVVMLSHTDNNPHNFRLWAYPMPKAAADKFALAVNSHDAMVKCLRMIRDTLPHVEQTRTIDSIRRAVAVVLESAQRSAEAQPEPSNPSPEYVAQLEKALEKIIELLAPGATGDYLRLHGAPESVSIARTALSQSTPKGGV